MRFKIYISPWMTIGTSLVLMGVVAFLGVVNYNRDKEQMGTLLQDKGAALIRSFEAGARTGIMGMMGVFANEIHLQILLEETAVQPDISYISIVDNTGTILAHNAKNLVGKIFLSADILKQLSPSQVPKWRIVEHKTGIKYFEVYKTFLPVPGKFDHLYSDWENGISAKKVLDPGNRPYIFIGMNVASFEAAMAEDLKHNIVMAAIIFSLGMAGVVSLFWAHNYTRSRKLLQDTRKFAAEVVTHLPVGIVVLGLDYHILYTNQVACTLLGTIENKMQGMNAKALLPGNIWSLYDRIKSGQQVAEKEIFLSAGSNKPIPVAVSAAHIHGQEGEYIGFMFVLKDLTEIRELQLKTQRIEKLATIGNLAAGIAHEVRNPLSSIRGYATYFGSQFEDASENRKAAELMAGEVDRVNRVISELLEFARPPDFKYTEIKVADLVDHSLRIVTHEAQTAGICITKNLEQGLPMLKVDPDRLTQVLLNFYINAIQAMKSGGRLSVQAGRRDASTLVIDISDTGRGIPMEDQPHIFDPYFTTKKNGTGLGMAIAHKIVENHGGSIQVKSSLESGTTISILLPINRKEANAR
ncbi:MAG: PAS domain-containing protein [Proteobacteria bacterium]|nr:PAS domain-containing protein [Desulfobacula sp.]MBU3953742.1 PAS domain-containing protein [Pseudomonadota bacterium]MBU4133148.1 PAS domain-containing protein [Pseudomonadota bacterium]